MGRTRRVAVKGMAIRAPITCVCDFCGSFVGKWKGRHFQEQHPQFKWHSVRVKNYRQYFCGLCNWRLDDFADLVSHYREAHKEALGQKEPDEVVRYKRSGDRTRLKCDVCGGAVKNNRKIAHIQADHSEYKMGYDSLHTLRCGYCSQSVGSTREAIVHIKRLHGKELQKAILSQQREGLTDPLVEESADAWEQRVGLFRDSLPEFTGRPPVGARVGAPVLGDLELLFIRRGPEFVKRLCGRLDFRGKIQVQECIDGRI